MAVKGDLTELSVVLAFLTFIGVALYMIAKRKGTKKTAKKAAKAERVVIPPPRRSTGVDPGSAPGWGGGRWLGHGDFLFRNRMDHPFQQMPNYAGHPMQGAVQGTLQRV